MKYIFCFWFVTVITTGINGQTYDTIRVGQSTTINLIFESGIVKHYLGSGEYFEGNSEQPLQDVLIDYVVGEVRMGLMARVKFKPTNLFIETDRGYYNFILVFSDWPKAQLVPIDLQRATMVKKRKREDEQADIAMAKEVAKRDTLAILAKEVYDKPNLKNPGIGEIDQKMTIYLNGIYIHNDYIFVRINMKNEGNVKYDVGYQDFWIKEEESRSTKRNAKEAPIAMKVLYTFNDAVKVVDKKEELSKVYVFQKFTIEESKYLSIELWESESKGQRRVELKVPDDEILNAKRI